MMKDSPTIRNTIQKQVSSGLLDAVERAWICKRQSLGVLSEASVRVILLSQTGYRDFLSSMFRSKHTQET